MEENHTDKLVQEILALEARAKQHAKNNHTLAYSIAIISVAGSISAAFLAAINISNWVVAFVAIIPAAVATINATLKFEPRSNWFYVKKHRLAELRRKLQFEGADTNDISRQLSAMESALQQDWVGFSAEGKDD